MQCRPPDRPRARSHTPGGRPARPSAALQTTTDDADKRQRTKQYWPIRRASSKMRCVTHGNIYTEIIADLAADVIRWQKWSTAICSRC